MASSASPDTNFKSNNVQGSEWELVPPVVRPKIENAIKSGKSQPPMRDFQNQTTEPRLSMASLRVQQENTDLKVQLARQQEEIAKLPKFDVEEEEEEGEEALTEYYRQGIEQDINELKVQIHGLTLANKEWQEREKVKEKFIHDMTKTNKMLRSQINELQEEPNQLEYKPRNHQSKRSQKIEPSLKYDQVFASNEHEKEGQNLQLRNLKSNFTHYMNKHKDELKQRDEQIRLFKVQIDIFENDFQQEKAENENLRGRLTTRTRELEKSLSENRSLIQKLEKSLSENRSLVQKLEKRQTIYRPNIVSPGCQMHTHYSPQNGDVPDRYRQRELEHSFLRDVEID